MSSNPCNAHGESVLHTVCRLGTGHDNDDPSLLSSTSSSSWSYELLQLMISIGQCDVSNCVDDYGRTPLHDACWCHNICYDTIALLLQQDPTLILLQDCRGATPLSYVPIQHHTTFIEFISRYKDQFFPEILGIGDSHDEIIFPSQLVRESPNRRPVPDPSNALSPDVARMVVSGRITPQELTFLLLQDNIDDDDDEDDDSESSYDDYEDYEDDGEDDSSTIRSVEGDGFLTPKKINKRARNVLPDDDDFEEGSDDEKSYSDLDEMLQRLQSPNHIRNSNAVTNSSKDDYEAVLGIGRPQYGYEMMNTSTKQDNSEQKTSSKNNNSTTLDRNDGNQDDEMHRENCASTSTEYVKPMSSVNIPTIHCSTTRKEGTTIIPPSLMVPTVTRTSTLNPNSSSPSLTKPLILDNHQHHPIMEMTNELLEFSV